MRLIHWHSRPTLTSFWNQVKVLRVPLYVPKKKKVYAGAFFIIRDERMLQSNIPCMASCVCPYLPRQKNSCDSFLQDFASCCCHEELISYTTCVYSAQLAESFPEDQDCSASTSCTLNASPSDKDAADSKGQNQWLMYGIYASIAMAILSLIYCCCCSRRSRIRRRIRNKKGGTVEVNVQCSSNTTETTNSKITETNNKSSTQQQQQQPQRKRRTRTPPRRPSSSSSEDESFNWDKYNQTFHTRPVVVTPRSSKKKARKKRVEESIRKARSVLKEAVKEQQQQQPQQVHKVFLMPALREVIDLLEEQRQDFEQKEKEAEEERMRLQYDLEHSKSHLQSLELSHDRTQLELQQQHYYSGPGSNRRNSTSNMIRRSSTMPLSSLSSSSMPTLNDHDPNQSYNNNDADDQTNYRYPPPPLEDESLSRSDLVASLDATEEEELQMEMIRLLISLREKQQELLRLGGDLSQQPPPPSPQEDTIDMTVPPKGTVRGPAAVQQQQPQQQLPPQRSFLGIDMTGSSWSGPLTDDDDDDEYYNNNNNDIEYCGQSPPQDPEYYPHKGQSGWDDRRPPPFSSPRTTTRSRPVSYYPSHREYSR